ncbi:MAG: hypothetical protein OXN25_05440 [Candidatus Poribacteria bacterium]|nr:hypothetical protein [Candidatus Poribacteria bacterium]
MKKEKGFWLDLWVNSKTGIVLFLVSVFFIIYSLIAIRYEIGQGWRGHPSVQDVLMDISRFIPVAGAFVATLIGGIDLIVFFSGLYIDWRKKRFQKAVASAVEAARSEAYAEGYAAGQRDKDSGDN